MTRSRVILAIALALALSTTAFAGKKQNEQVEQLEARVAELEAQVQALQKALDDTTAQLSTEMDQKIDVAMQEFAQRETKAAQELRAINTLAGQGKQLEAKERMGAFFKKYAGTNAIKSAARLNQELAVVGKNAPPKLNLEKWYSGEEGSVDLSAEGTHLLVFFETWCPHCKREVPKLRTTYDKFKDKGLSIVGLTKVTKSSTDEKVVQFVEQHKLVFPVVKERGDVSQYFNVAGVPAAAVVKDGKVIWRGHPATLNDSMIQSWL
jgi:thiol-disulfide isomerase/thioredoxin